MSGLFITSTGTEIGKTFITASLCHQLREKGRPVDALKPVISGIDEKDMTGTDTAILAKSLCRPLTQDTVNHLSPFRYRAPLAPSMAAELEGKVLDYAKLIEVCNQRLHQNPFTLIEGVGGSFVPLTHDRLVADWIADIRLPSVLVSGSYLGTISHTLATTEAMTARGLDITAIILCESAGEDHPDLMKTLDEIRRLTGLPAQAIPRLTGPDPWKKTPDLLACTGLA